MSCRKETACHASMRIRFTSGRCSPVITPQAYSRNLSLSVIRCQLWNEGRCFSYHHFLLLLLLLLLLLKRVSMWINTTLNLQIKFYLNAHPFLFEWLYNGDKEMNAESFDVILNNNHIINDEKLENAFHQGSTTRSTDINTVVIRVVILSYKVQSHFGPA